MLQGIVGSTPWNAMVFFTMWLQLMGFSDLMASLLMAVFACGCALGAFAGGLIGGHGHRLAQWAQGSGMQEAAQRWPDPRRVWALQVTT